MSATGCGESLMVGVTDEGCVSARAAVDRAVADAIRTLVPWTKHRPLCPVEDGGRCDCGFAAALEGLRDRLRPRDLKGC